MESDNLFEGHESITREHNCIMDAPSNKTVSRAERQLTVSFDKGW
jgi:hypothetical protein